MKKIIIILLFFLIFAGYTGFKLNNKIVVLNNPKTCTNGKSIKVLFLGNSYTSTNSLPVLVENIACSLGYKIEHDSYTPGGASFGNHVNDPVALSKINSEKWDFVVLQNQSQIPAFKNEIKNKSLPDAQMLVRQIKENNAESKIIYFATWGRKNGDQQNCAYYQPLCTFEGHTVALKEGYDVYQSSTGGLIAPVGSYWQFIVQDSKINRPFEADDLWSKDGNHPSLIGSYLAAATILKQIISAPVSSTEFTAGLDINTVKYILSVVDSL